MTNKPTLDDLFDEAKGYGRVFLNQHKDGTWSAKITFNTASHIALEATSGFNHTDPASALMAAIKKASEIVESMRTFVVDTVKSTTLLEKAKCILPK